MGLETDHGQRRPQGGGGLSGGGDDLAVAAMDAVEIAKRDRGAARVRVEVPPAVENVKTAHLTPPH
jgi:hypothetical protein